MYTININMYIVGFCFAIYICLSLQKVYVHISKYYVYKRFYTFIYIYTYIRYIYIYVHKSRMHMYIYICVFEQKLLYIQIHSLVFQHKGSCIYNIYIQIYIYVYISQKKIKIAAKFCMNSVTWLAPRRPPSWRTTHKCDITLFGKLFSERQLSFGVSIIASESVEPECVYIIIYLNIYLQIYKYKYVYLYICYI